MNSFGEAASQAASRYFGGSTAMRNLGLTGGRTASVGTTDSFTEEQHSMTRQELEYQPSEEEHAFNEDVMASLRERMVWGQGSTSWGLRWECGTVDQPDVILGGWLSQVTTKSFLNSNIANGISRFCVLNDTLGEFQQCLDATLKVRRSIPYEEMHTVRPRKEGEVWYLQIFGKNVKWELLPIKQGDRDLILRWTCALQYRSGSYDSALSRDVTRANKAALWTQSQYRMWKAKVRVQRKRERKNHIVNRFAAYFGWADDDDDEDEEDGFGEGEPAPGYVESALEVASNLWGTVGSWLGLGGGAIQEEEEEVEEAAPLPLDNKRISVSIQHKDALPELLEGQVEDEIWENQRWTPGIGWSSKTLGKTERCAWTDRLGRGNFAGKDALPLEPGWRATEMQVDLSGANRAMCDAEGFTYSFDWPRLDADLAKGNFTIFQGSKDFVRRRRWYRYRERDEASEGEAKLFSTIEPILCQGWLGMKTSQGRWHSRQFCLVRPGLTIGEVKYRHPALVQFRVGFKDFAGVTRNGGTDGAQWRMLTDKSVSVLELPPKSCHCDETAATAKYEGHFHLILDGVMRTFCARDAAERTRWCQAITQACRDAIKQGRPRTMRLVGGAFETACYPTIIMDSILIAPVDAVEEGFFQSPSVRAAIHVRLAHGNVTNTPWDMKTGARNVKYTDRDGLRVEETWQRARTEPGEGFIVDRRMECPEAQFGDEFAIKLRFVLCRCEVQGEYGTRVLCSLDIEFLKQTMMVGFITSEAKKNATVELRDVWLPCVVAFLKTQGVLSADSNRVLDGQSKITWGAQSAVSSKPSKLTARPAPVPREESERIEIGKW